MNAKPPFTLLEELLQCFEDIEADGYAIDEMIAACRSALEIKGVVGRAQGHMPTHHGLLDDAIAAIDAPGLQNLKSALLAARDHLRWKVDDGGYYAAGDDVGEGYRSGNMHSLLVGPQDALVHSTEHLLGLFLLAPWTLYRDHKHLASEIYIPLTGPSGWRFGLRAWVDHLAGSRILNAPNVVHATRVYDRPFLALFAWTSYISSKCSVVVAGDWAETEFLLAQRNLARPQLLPICKRSDIGEIGEPDQAGVYWAAVASQRAALDGLAIPKSVNPKRSPAVAGIRKSPHINFGG